MQLLRAAVIIPVKNERAGLEALEESLRSQTRVPDEVIFVDGGSTDGTLEFLRDLPGRDSLFMVHEVPGAYPGAARNAAVENTSADIVLQIDGGNLPNDAWVENLCEPIERGKADYVVGGIRMMPIWKNLLGMRVNVAEIYGASLFDRFQDQENVGGGSCVAYRRRVWQNVGGFPPSLRYGEDKIFAAKVRESGIRTAFAADAWICWQIGPRLFDVLARQVRYQSNKLKRPRKPGVLLRSAGLTLAFPAAVAIGVKHPLLLAAAFFMAAVYLARRIGKVWGNFRARSGEVPWREKPLLMALVAFLELANIGARAAGTLLGIAGGGDGSPEPHQFRAP
ncbi:glycosyltransferase [Candidatus Moduliflexota bacterium]